MKTERTYIAARDGGCQEVHSLSKASAYPCNAKAVVVVWSKHEGRSYRMCAACADQNVKKNNGMVIAAGFNSNNHGKAAMMTNTENGNGKTEEQPTISYRVSWVDENDAEQKLSFASKEDASKQAVDMSTTHGAARLDTIADEDVVECTLYEKGIEMTSVNPSSIEKKSSKKGKASKAKGKAAKAAKPAKGAKKVRESKVDGIAGEFGLRADSTRAKVLVALEKAPKKGLDLKSLSKEALGNASETSVGLTNGAIAFLGGRIKKAGLPYKIEKVKDEEGGSMVTFSRTK